jgi:hypothetical protein
MTETDYKHRVVGLEAWVVLLEQRVLNLETKLGLGPKTPEPAPTPKKDEAVTKPCCGQCGAEIDDTNAMGCPLCKSDHLYPIVRKIFKCDKSS